MEDKKPTEEKCIEALKILSKAKLINGVECFAIMLLMEAERILPEKRLYDKYFNKKGSKKC